MVGSRLGFGIGFLVLAVAAVAGLRPVGAVASSQAIAADTQAYFSDQGPDAFGRAEGGSEAGFTCQAGPTPPAAPSPVGQQSDSYAPCPDPYDIHVGVSAGSGSSSAQGQVTYHALIHLATAAAPPGSTINALSFTLYPTTNPQRANQENVNTSAAVLDAFPLTAALPADTCTSNPCTPGDTGSQPPGYDASATPAVGKTGTDPNGATMWTFDLTPMMSYWNTHTYYGVALIPDAAAATQPWSIGFDKTLTTAKMDFTPPQASSSQASVPVAPIVTTGNSGFTGGGAAPVTAPTVAPTTAPARPAQPAAPATVTTHGTTPATGLPMWALIFGVSLAAAAGLLAQPVAQALSGTSGLRLGLLSELKLHPRLAAVAATMLLWSSAWGVYSGVNGAASTPVVSTVTSSNGPGVNGVTFGPSGSPATPGASSSTGASGSSGGGGQSGGGSVGAAAFAGASVPAVPQAHLYAPDQEQIGLTNTTIQLCAHAALTFGSAFHINASDLNVFWQMVDNPKEDPYPHTSGQAGIYNRQIVQPDGKTPGISVQDDGYQPSKAVGAAQACQDQPGGDFFLLSGIGFDQIPAVRVWAEQHNMLYIHHIATQQGTQGLRYSFTMLPTLEQVGVQFAQYYLSHWPSHPALGVIYRNSSNWDPGRLTFNATLKAAGITPVDEEAVDNNQGSYQQPLVTLQTKGAKVVLIWENALAAANIMDQANQANYNPGWMLFPFNLTLETLTNEGFTDSYSAATGLNQIGGLVPWPAYNCNWRNLPGYSTYASEYTRFEKAYAEYDNTADLCGYGGDLLFGTWVAWDQVADLLLQCGPNCTRDDIAGLMLNGYHSQVPATCPVDFRGTDGHHGGIDEDVYGVTQTPGTPKEGSDSEDNNKYSFYNSGFCEQKPSG